MKILVCISKVPDTTAKISFTDNNTKFNEDKVSFIINPYDEWYALVRALELKEAGGGTVTVINAGPAQNEQVIRKALALGADDAIRIDMEPLDAFQVAAEIAEVAKDGGYDLIMTGKETIDYNGGVLGGILAELMDMAYVSMASKLDVADNKLTIEREIEGMKEIVEASMPCVVSAQKGMAEARIPNMRGIMASKSKPVNVVAPSGKSPRSTVESFTLPPAKGDCKLVSPDNVGELVDLLRNEAKVI
jgi:electron transfer flavoprotein beta subunit